MMDKNKAENAKSLQEVIEANPEVEWILASARNESLTPKGDFLLIFYEKYKPWLSAYAGWEASKKTTKTMYHYDALYDKVVGILERKQIALDKAYVKAEQMNATEPIGYEYLS